MNPRDARLRRLGDLFRDRFGVPPSRWFRAPGRVELMGSHTDYNLGRALTMPVSRDVWMAIHPRADRVMQVYSANMDSVARCPLDHHVPQHDWADYMRGVASVLAGEGLPLVGFDAAIDSTIPLGAGLSSSAAIEAVTAVALQSMGEWRLAPARMARLCQRAENEFVGVNCGMLDQYSVCIDAEGGALWLDCRTRSTRPSPIAPDVSVVICDTRAVRSVSQSEYGRRRQECEDAALQLGVDALSAIAPADVRARTRTLSPVLARRCRFIVEEHARVDAFASALSGGDRVKIRDLTSDSFRDACELFEIGAPSMTAMMQAMRDAPGFIGGRQSGAGFGGCLVAFVDGELSDVFTETVRARYARATGCEPAVYVVQSSAPAGTL